MERPHIGRTILVLTQEQEDEEMIRSRLKPYALIVCLVSLMSAPGWAQQAATLAEAVSPRILFLTSGGYWENSGEGSAPEAEATAAETGLQRGYYRLIAIRGEDNRSLLQLQQIALTPEGPKLATTIGIDEINNLGGYVTDIRPEDSTGSASRQGFGAYVYLKTDPSVVEPETWSVYIDEFGDILVEQSSN
jgi:hypothetical protein